MFSFSYLSGVDRACLLPKCGLGDTVQCNNENAVQSNNMHMDTVYFMENPKKLHHRRPQTVGGNKTCF